MLLTQICSDGVIASAAAGSEVAVAVLAIATSALSEWLSCFSPQEKPTNGSEATDTLGPLRVSVRLGLGPEKKDLKRVTTPTGLVRFEGTYEREKTPLYRWGYLELFKTTLLSETSGESAVTRIGLFTQKTLEDELIQASAIYECKPRI